MYGSAFLRDLSYLIFVLRHTGISFPSIARFGEVLFLHILLMFPLVAAFNEDYSTSHHLHGFPILTLCS